jgi:hypothetical protein
MTFGASDVIAFKDLNTGGNSAGNGGDGWNFGDLKNYQTATFEPTNKAYGSDVDVKTGDYVHQKAELEAADPKEFYKKGKGDLKDTHEKGKADGKDLHEKGKPSDDGGSYSKLTQTSDSGENESKVWADTSAYQKNWSKIEQSSNQIAGNGGDGGDHNLAKGGDVGFALVHSNSSYEVDYTELKDVLNHSEHISFDDFLHG